jgi:UDP-N-acetyl-D-mannosaminuronate dehydrogenase
VLGLTYREGVSELAYTRAVPLIRFLIASGALVSAYDPRVASSAIERYGARAYEWGNTSEAVAIIMQTADPLWSELDFGRFPRLRVVLDCRNGLANFDWPSLVFYQGIGVSNRRAPS